MSPRRVRAVSCLLALVVASAAGSSPALAAKKGVCPRGAWPVLKGSGAKAKVVKRHGKVRCRKPAKPSKAGFAKPAAVAQRELATTADQIAQALAVNPDAFAGISRVIGPRRTAALTQLALRAWRKQAGAARARLAAADGELHINQTFGAGGADGGIKLDAAPVSTGGKLGLEASATIDVNVSADGLKNIASGALEPGTTAKAKVEISFSDVPVACPTAAGKVAGRLIGKAKVALTIAGPGGTETHFAAAEMDVAYQLTVGENARWETIDDVDAKSTFSYGGSGKGTETWRGRRLGTGFGQKGVLGGGDWGANIAAQTQHFDASHGGVFGPHSRVRWDTGPTAGDLKSISNIKGLIITSIATDYLTLASLEYVREIVAPRLQKHWYDDEACLKLEGKPAAAKLKAGQTTKVTTKNAKAADGSPVKTNLTGSGVASLKPAQATMAAGGVFDFTLTAPNATPTRSSWKVVALSRAGKKTVEGSLGDQPGYEVTLDDHETGTFATHDGTGRLVATLRLVPVAQSDPATWTASGTLVWSEVTATSKIQYCDPISPISGGAWTVTATQAGPDAITVTLDFSADTRVLWTMHCDFPPDPGGGNDPPPTDSPGLLGVNALAAGPLTFTVPAIGGIQALKGEILDGGDGLRSSGTLTVTAVG